MNAVSDKDLIAEAIAHIEEVLAFYESATPDEREKFLADVPESMRAKGYDEIFIAPQKGILQKLAGPYALEEAQKVLELREAVKRGEAEKLLARRIRAGLPFTIGQGE